MICSKTMNTMHRFSHIILKTILIPRATHSPRQHWRRRVEQRLGVRLAAGKPLRQKPSPLEDRRQLPLAENPPASVLLPYDADADAETKAFVEDIAKTWDQRRKGSTAMEKREGNSLYSLESIKRDYRLKKQRIHAGLWVKEIDWQEEDKLGNSIGGGGDDIERLLDSYSEIFDSSNDDLNNSKIPRTSEFKNKPDGWETTTKAQDGIVWEMSQRAEDILLQEYER